MYGRSIQLHQGIREVSQERRRGSSGRPVRPAVFGYQAHTRPENIAQRSQVTGTVIILCTVNLRWRGGISYMMLAYRSLCSREMMIDDMKSIA